MATVCPGTYPTVLNGEMYFNSSTTVEFACLPGFAMSGNKVITCTGSAIWTDAPTCSAITDDDEVFPEWWLVVAAIVLVLLVLACCLCIICYFCCGRGGGDNAVHPYSRHNNGNCCDGCGNGCCRGNGCCGGRCGSRGCCKGGCGPGGCCGSLCRSGSCCLFGSSGGCCSCCSCCADGGESGTGGDSSNGGGRGGGGGGDGKGGYQTVHHTEGPNGQKGVYFVPVNSMPSEARGDGEMMDYSNNTPRPLKPAKEVKAWLPHSNPVRNTHNTSTK